MFAKLSPILLCLVCAAPLAYAEEATRYNLVQLDTNAKQEVSNDTMNAVLYIEKQDTDSARLANVVNKLIKNALAEVALVAGVQAETGNMNNSPIYKYENNTNRITGWNAHAEIRLKSQDFEAMSKIIGRLQNTMLLQGVSFSVSDSSRKAAEDKLTTASIQAFYARANIIQQAMGGKQFKIVNMNISQNNQWQPQQPMFEARALMKSAAMDVAAPVVQGGDSTLQVSVSGQIEVLP